MMVLEPCKEATSADSMIAIIAAVVIRPLQTQTSEQGHGSPLPLSLARHQPGFDNLNWRMNTGWS